MFVSGAGVCKCRAGQIGYTELPTARHRCDFSLKEAVLPGRNDTEMAPANYLHASAYYSEYNERFDLVVMLDWCNILFL